VDNALSCFHNAYWAIVDPDTFQHLQPVPQGVQTAVRDRDYILLTRPKSIRAHSLLINEYARAMIRSAISRVRCAQLSGRFVIHKFKQSLAHRSAVSSCKAGAPSPQKCSAMATASIQGPPLKSV